MWLNTKLIMQIEQSKVMQVTPPDDLVAQFAISAQNCKSIPSGATYNFRDFSNHGLNFWVRRFQMAETSVWILVRSMLTIRNYQHYISTDDLDLRYEVEADDGHDSGDDFDDDEHRGELNLGAVHCRMPLPDDVKSFSTTPRFNQSRGLYHHFYQHCHLWWMSITIQLLELAC